MTQDILFSSENHIGLVMLNREKALNALTLEMILALEKQLRAWKVDPTIHAVVVQSSSPKAFCAGGDVRWLYEKGRSDHASQMLFFKHEYRLNHLIHDLGKPYIALMDGLTMGGGVGISLHGSHPVASDRFIFAMPETSIGFFADIGASYLLLQCPGQLGLYLAMTGGRLNAEESKAASLVKYVVPSSRFPEVVKQFIEMDLSKDSYLGVHACLASHATLNQNNSLKALQDKVDQYFSAPDMVTILQHLSASSGSWEQETLTLLQSKSPLSLVITFYQMQRAAKLSLVECLKMDYILAHHFTLDHDFYEGVRALLIDKDKSPRWQPADTAHVTPNLVRRYFDANSEALVLS